MSLEEYKNKIIHSDSMEILRQSADRYYKRLGEDTIKRNAEMKKWVGVDPKTIPSVQEFLRKYDKELKKND